MKKPGPKDIRFRVYFYWLNRYGTTHKDCCTFAEAEEAIREKFKNKRCALAQIYNYETGASGDYYKNEI